MPGAGESAVSKRDGTCSHGVSKQVGGAVKRKEGKKKEGKKEAREGGREKAEELK